MLLSCTLLRGSSCQRWIFDDTIFHVQTNYTRREWLVTPAALFPRPVARAAPDKPMQGAFMILSTPYTSSKALDYEDLAAEVDFLERCGVQGLVWPQNASELSKLTREERLRGMEVLAKAAKGRSPVLVLGVQGDDTKEMLDYASRAEQLAPDAVIAIPPKKARSLDDYREYYRALSKLTKRPVFIQTSGGSPGVEPTVEFIVELAREFPNFGYVKGRARSCDSPHEGAPRAPARPDQARVRRASRRRAAL